MNFLRDRKKLKKLLTNTVFVVLSALNRIIPKNDRVILMYSNMGFRDNLLYLYRYLIAHHYNDAFRILCSRDPVLAEPLPDHVKTVGGAAAVLRFLRAGHVYYCFGKLPIYPARRQTVIQMWHGTSFKAADEWQMESRKKKSYYTYMLVSSDYMKVPLTRVHGVDEAHMALCGQPRTDVMLEGGEHYPEFAAYDKTVIWMPTFRTSSVLGYANTAPQERLFPLFDAADYEKLNETLRKRNICLIVKLHPLQDAADFQTGFSHLWLLTDREFRERGFDLYRLLGQCDALVTDYSSVFYDFMLLDRPMAFTVEDFEEYRQNRGFVVDDPDYITAGYKIRDKEDFYRFLVDLSVGVDRYADVRREVNALVNPLNDGQQCRRALELSGIIHFSAEDCGAPMTDAESRAVQIAMLDALDAFCEEHGLRYFLSGGTLLGALRHHGFIPWDDDIDVNMPRPDCEKLLALTGGNLTGYRLEGPDDGKFRNDCNWLRIYDDNTVIENFRRGQAEDPWYHPIFMDIFPIEGLPEGMGRCRLHWARAYVLDKMRWASSLTRLEAQSRAGKVFLALCRVPAKIVGYRWWGRAIERCAKCFDFEGHRFVGVTTTSQYLTRERVEKEPYLQTVRVEFEGKEYDAPGSYDTYLRQLYGETYMELPPAERQKTHHAFHAYWRSGGR